MGQFIFTIDDDDESGTKKPCPKGKKNCPKCHGSKREPVTGYRCTFCDDNGCVPSYYMC